jgi:prolyl-tRNA synthetase
VILNGDQEAVVSALDQLESAATAAGLSLLVDDRGDSAGIKFKDADLLGMPARLTLSPRSLEKGGVEFRNRKTGETTIVALGEATAAIRAILEA